MRTGKRKVADERGIEGDQRPRRRRSAPGAADPKCLISENHFQLTVGFTRASREIT
jgi:hypothetical protein